LRQALTRPLPLGNRAAGGGGGEAGTEKEGFTKKRVRQKKGAGPNRQRAFNNIQWRVGKEPESLWKEAKGTCRKKVQKGKRNLRESFTKTRKPDGG